MDTPISNAAVRAHALRVGANDSIVTLAVRLSVPALDIIRMERGDDGYERVARQVIGHYWGRRNERPLASEVGRRIRALRHEAGHTATQLAALIGVRPSLVWQVEGSPHMSKRTCRKIADFYGVAASELEAA